MFLLMTGQTTHSVLELLELVAEEAPSANKPPEVDEELELVERALYV